MDKEIITFYTFSYIIWRQNERDKYYWEFILLYTIENTSQLIDIFTSIF